MTVLLGLYPTVMLLVRAHRAIPESPGNGCGDARSATRSAWPSASGSRCRSLTELLGPWFNANTPDKRVLSIGGLVLMWLFLGGLVVLFRFVTG